MPRNGDTTARGYGWRDHQARRRQLAPLVAAGHATCRRCHHRIPPPPPGHTCRRGCRSPSCWDLGHDDHDRTAPAQPEHRHRVGPCPGNRAAGAAHGNRRRGQTTRRRNAQRPTLIVDDW